MNDKQIKTLLQELWEKGNKPKFDLRPVSKQTIIDICQFAAEKFLKEPPFLEFDPPVKICGDIHGQFRDLLRIFSFANQPSTTQKYLFLGDYVDRGPQSIETILYLFLQKIRYPKTVLLLRGNHEIPSVNRNYGFAEEKSVRSVIIYDWLYCVIKDIIILRIAKHLADVKTVLFTTTYSFEFGLSRAIKRQIMERYNDNFIWQVFQDVFNCMPVAALISRKIFCAHGGISPDLKHFDQLRRLIRPTIIPERGLLNDLLWSDPSHDTTTKGWAESSRGSRMFGTDEVSMFCRCFDVDMIIRAHEVQLDGYLFECDNHLVTVFSAINYTNQFNNAAGVVCIDEKMKLSVKCLKPSGPPVALSSVTV